MGFAVGDGVTLAMVLMGLCDTVLDEVLNIGCVIYLKSVVILLNFLFSAVVD
jgi:hypothetical protein